MSLKNRFKIIKEFEAIPTSVLSDVLNRGQVINPQIKPYNLLAGQRIAGFAFTVEAMAGCNWGAHLALYKAKSYNILVIDGKGYTRNSIWGGLQTYVAVKRRIRAVIIDGSFRDLEEIRELKYCLCAKAITCAGPHKGWRDKLQAPISCGNVVIHPDDLIIIDKDGIVVVAEDKIKETIKKAKERIKMEEGWKRRIDKGEIFYKILKLDKKFKK